MARHHSAPAHATTAAAQAAAAAAAAADMAVHAASQVSDVAAPRHHAPCPGFPTHTIIAIYFCNFFIALLVFMGFMTAISELPSIYPPRLKRLGLVASSSLFAWFLLMHMLTPLGLLPGVWGVLLVSLVLWLAAGVALWALPLVRDILRLTPQTWLVGLHSTRVMSFLYLSLFDVGLLPLGFAGPAGWGGLLVGVLAPVVSHTIATKHRHARGFAVLWNLLGLLEIAVASVFESAFMGRFLRARLAAHQPVGYLWYSTFVISRFTNPMLVLVHFFSLYKFFTEREEQPAMIWIDDEFDDDIKQLYNPDSPGPQTFIE